MVQSQQVLDVAYEHSVDEFVVAHPRIYYLFLVLLCLIITLQISIRALFIGFIIHAIVSLLRSSRLFRFHFRARVHHIVFIVTLLGRSDWAVLLVNSTLVVCISRAARPHLLRICLMRGGPVLLVLNCFGAN